MIPERRRALDSGDGFFRYAGPTIFGLDLKAARWMKDSQHGGSAATGKFI
jgi:hypothetical protein